MALRPRAGGTRAPVKAAARARHLPLQRSAAGRPPSGSAGAASARRGARSTRRRGAPAVRTHGGRPGVGAGPADRRGRRRGRAAARRPASPSSTGCSAAAWCPARSCCSPASRASASRRCCSRSRPRGRRARRRALYVTGEESAAQVRLRAEPHRRARTTSSTSPPRPTWRAVLGHVDAVKPDAARRRLGADHRDRRGRRRRPAASPRSARSPPR